MAVGFTPKHSEDFPLENLNQKQFLVIAKEAAEALGWKVFYISKTGLKISTDRGIFSANELIKVKIAENTAVLESSTIGSAMVDFGKNKRNIKKYTEAINDLQQNFNEDELNEKYDALTLVPDEEDDLQLPPPKASDNFKEFLFLFIPRKGYFVTPVLININIIIFVMMVILGVSILTPDNESMLKWGANFRPLTLAGQSWRLFTNCFLHFGVFHLLMNMYALMYIGLLLEPLLGKSRFMVAYFITGILGSLTSLWWHDLTISAGASGAIFGMYGVFLAMLTTNLIDKDIRKNLLASIAVFVGYNLLYGLKGGIDNAAHIGGLLSGLIMGYAFMPSLEKPNEPSIKLVTIVLLMVSALSTSFIVYRKIPNDLAEYETRIKDFVTKESLALEVFGLPRDTPKDKLLYEIKDRGIYYWNENIDLLNELGKLDLPESVEKKNSLLKKYCQLRIKSYELIYKIVNENDTIHYKSELTNYNKQIKSMIDNLQQN